MAGNTLLRANSCHPQHTISAIPKWKLIPAKRACMTEKDFNTEMDTITKRLSQWGYSERTLKDAESSVRIMDRKELLFRDNAVMKKSMDIPSIVISTAFSSDFAELRKIIKKHLPALHFDDILHRNSNLAKIP